MQERGYLGTRGGLQDCLPGKGRGALLRGSFRLSRQDSSRAEGPSAARSLPPSQGRTWGPRGRTLSSSTGAAQLGLTLVGAVGMSLVTVVSAVIVPIAGPVHGDAAPTVALELVAGAGVAAARLVAVVPTVIVWRGKKSGKGLRECPAGQEGGLVEARQEGGRQ